MRNNCNNNYAKGNLMFSKCRDAKFKFDSATRKTHFFLKSNTLFQFPGISINEEITVFVHAFDHGLFDQS